MSRNNVVLQPNYYSSSPIQRSEDSTNYAQIFADLNARNQQANALNAKLEERAKNPELALLNDFIAINDQYKAKKNAEMQTPMYKEAQAKDQAKALAQALLGTKQVESMSYGGNPVKQSPDGKYWLENGQEVTDVANIQTNNKFDPIVGALNAAKQGNVLGVDILTKLMQSKQGMDLADKLAIIQAQTNAKAEIESLKPKKDADSKMSELSKTKDIVGELTPWFGDNQYRTNEVSNIVNQALLDPQLKNADVLEALNQAKAASSQWYKGKTDVDTDLLVKLLNQYKNK